MSNSLTRRQRGEESDKKCLRTSNVRRAAAPLQENAADNMATELPPSTTPRAPARADFTLVYAMAAVCLESGWWYMSKQNTEHDVFSSHLRVVRVQTVLREFEEW